MPATRTRRPVRLATPKQTELLTKLAADLDRPVPADLTIGAASALIDAWMPEARQARRTREAAERAATVPGWADEAEVVMAAFGNEDGLKGRFTLRGQFISTKVVDNRYNGNEADKGVFQEAETGRRVWMTVPADVMSAARWYGVKITSLTFTVTVTVEAKRDDLTFGFGSRPTKVTIELPTWAPMFDHLAALGAEFAGVANAYARDRSRAALIPCCGAAHVANYLGRDSHGRGGCGATVRIMSDVWDTCPCKNEATVWSTPASDRPAAWYGSEWTPPNQR